MKIKQLGDSKDLNLQDFLEFLKIKSISNNLNNVSQAVDFVVNKFTDKADIYYFTCNNKKSALIVPRGVAIDKFDVILNGHVDVVDAPDKLFEPKVEDSKIFARGAYDMKGGLYAGMMFFNRYLRSDSDALEKLPKVGLQIVPDEEVGGFDGTLCQLQKGVRAKFAVALEPTDLNIAIKAKGVFWIKITAFGESAHSAYPWKGINALGILQKFINNLENSFKLPQVEEWKTTYNLAQIYTSNKTNNMIPDNATLELDIRYIPEDKQRFLEFLESQEKILPIKVDIYIDEPGISNNKTSKYIKSLISVLQKYNKNIEYKKRSGSSDIRHFARYNIPGIEFGPKGNNLHKDNEYVEWNSVLDVAEIVWNWILELGK